MQTMTVMDMDGTLAVYGPLDKMAEADPWPALLDIALAASKTDSLFILTARHTEQYRDMTKDWLFRQGIPTFGLLMRGDVADKDIPKFKLAKLFTLITAYKPNEVVFYEDSQDVLDCVVKARKKKEALKPVRVFRCTEGVIQEL
jgi:hypothetical protein